MDENDELASKVNEQVSVAGEWSLAMQKQGGVIEGLPAEPCTHCLNVTASCAWSTTHHPVVVSPGSRTFLLA